MSVDLVVGGGRVVDGTGNPWFHGDVLVDGDRIADVLASGFLPHESSTQHVSAEGMVVCLRFIDIQSHSIMSLMQDGRCLSKVTQGVISEIMGEAWTPEWAEPRGTPSHPRGYGTYPRVLGTYVRQDAVLTLDEAIRKTTSSVANRLGLRERGVLKKGCFADFIAFDPRTVDDRATYERPHQLSTGIRDVWINGTLVLSGGAHTGAMPGRFLRGPGVGR